MSKKIQTQVFEMDIFFNLENSLILIWRCNCVIMLKTRRILRF